MLSLDGEEPRDLGKKSARFFWTKEINSSVSLEPTLQDAATPPPISPRSAAKYVDGCIYGKPKVNLPLPSPFDHGSGYAMLWLAAHAMPGPTSTNQYFMPEMTIHSSFEAGHYEYETIVNRPIRWCTL